jgi:hypothetical protein
MTTLYVDNIAPNLASKISAPDIQLPTGSVIQVVSEETQNTQTTTSGSFVSANHSITITPTSSSSKIYVGWTAGIYTDTAGGGGRTTIYRGATQLGEPTQGFTYLYLPDSSGGAQIHGQYLDSPNTTDPVTYYVYFNSFAGTLYYGVNGGSRVITAMEIAG